MRKNFIKIFISVIGIVTLCSCSDFLSNKPKGIMIPKYYEDYSILMNNMRFGYNSTNYPNFMTDDVVLTNSEDVTSTLHFNVLQDFEQACYKFDKGNIFPEGKNDYFYTQCYEEIYVYNAVANNIINVPDATLEQKESLKAEAITKRAFIFFQLVNIYGKQYDKQTADKDYGIPIITSEDINSTYVRNSVKEVYDKIVEDILWSCDKLPDVVKFKSHLDKAGAYAILAKVYLFMGEYKLALEAANNSLKNNKQIGLLDYKLYTNHQIGVWDRITDDYGETMPYQDDNIETLFIQYPENDFSGKVFASDDLMATYKKDLPLNGIDKREELFYAKDQTTTYSDYVFPGLTMYTSFYFPNLGLSMQEIYLILAECEARVGSASDATKYLDIIRDSRIVNNMPLVAKDNKDALRMALDERRRETPFWGFSRFIDLKRLNKESELAKTIVHTLDGVTYTLEPNDSRWVMPLPHNVITFNPNIPQYDR